MKKQKQQTQNTQAGNAGNYPVFEIGDKVVFNNGLPRAVFGIDKGPFVVASSVYEDDLGEPCVKIQDKDGVVAKFPISILSVVPKERTDEDIIKGLECCSNCADCESCPYDNVEEDCVRLNMLDALGLIKRQKEHLDKLSKDNQALIREAGILYHVSHYACSDLDCNKCFLKDKCLQLKECGKKDPDKKEDVAGCWAMFMMVTEGVLEDDGTIERSNKRFNLSALLQNLAKHGGKQNA